jgi:regulator of sigma E protease
MNRNSETLQNVVIGIAALAAAYFFWDTVKGLLIFVFTLGVLIAVHEWGHFIAARFSGVRIYEFAIGMGPRIWTYWHKNGTDFTIHALPIGGFVNLKGMQPEDPPTPDGVNGRRPAERALIYLAGPLMNAILALAVALTLGFFWGTEDTTKVLIGELVAKSEAKKMQVVRRNGQPAEKMPAGLRIGDQLLEIAGKPIRDFEAVIETISPNAGKPIEVKVRRGSDELVFAGTPKRGKSGRSQFVTIAAVPAGAGVPVQPGDQLDRIDGETTYMQGVPKEQLADAVEKRLRQTAGKPVTLVVWRHSDTKLELKGTGGPLDIEIKDGERYVGQLGFKPAFGAGPRVGLVKSAQMGFNGLFNLLMNYQYLFSRPKELGENLSGPLKIWDVLREADKLPPLNYFSIFASLSFSLAIFNLFPVFILDGGHMLLLFFEVIRRRRLEPNMQRAAQMVGLVFIGILFIFIFGKDWMKTFG